MPQAQSSSRYASSIESSARARDEVIRGALGLGWQMLRECASPDDTVRLLKAAARRCKVNISTNVWSMDGIVTFKVTSK